MNVYAMQCYLLPKGFLDGLLSHIRRFFWHGDAHGKHIHWSSWDCLTKPKEEGGLGFRDLHLFNLALLAKQGWRLIINPESFWARILKGLYFPKGNFLTANKGTHPSWLWQSLLQGRDILLQGIRWQVGNGEKISFWTQKWVPYNSDFFIREPRGPFSNVSKVSDFIVNGEWDYLKLQLHLLPREANFVSQIPISNTGVEDRLVWHYDNKGNYSVRSGYRQALVLKEKEIDHASSSSNPSAIKLATSENVPPWTLSALIMDIRYWISDMKLDLVWTSRRCNGVAHHVAKIAFSSPVSFMWESYFPVEITSIARSDLA